VPGCLSAGLQYGCSALQLAPTPCHQACWLPQSLSQRPSQRPHQRPRQLHREGAHGLRLRLTAHAARCTLRLHPPREKILSPAFAALAAAPALAAIARSRQPSRPSAHFCLRLPPARRRGNSPAPPPLRLAARCFHYPRVYLTASPQPPTAHSPRRCRYQTVSLPSPSPPCRLLSLVRPGAAAAHPSARLTDSEPPVGLERLAAVASPARLALLCPSISTEGYGARTWAIVA
jgi:hypothetical protein